MDKYATCFAVGIQKVVEAFNGEGGDVSNKKNKNKTVDINGFQVLASQVTKVRKIFTAHPDIALDFKPTIQEVKTAYMNVLLRVIKTLHKPPKSLSETRLSKASSELSELMKVGFKLDWLRLKLDGVSLERKKINVDGSQERVKNLELMELSLKYDSLNTKLDEVSLERKKKDDTNDSRANQVEEHVKNLELMELSLKLDSLERKKADDTNESRARQVEKRVKNLELMDVELNKCCNSNLDDLAWKKSYDAIFFKQIEDRVMGVEFKLDSLNTKLEEISKEKKKADDADGSLVQQLEESVKNIELMVSHLKVELDKKKNISSADGFLLVD
uniref:MATH domain-containing protein n=1 Tax=Brassica campestris TaxID=3711 RepID=M4CKG3_BRACM